MSADVTVLISLSPIILYISNFKNYSLSKEPADWGTFGDYIGGIYSVVLAVVLVYVTYTINRKNDELKECIDMPANSVGLKQF